MQPWVVMASGSERSLLLPLSRDAGVKVTATMPSKAVVFKFVFTFVLLGE